MTDIPPPRYRIVEHKGRIIVTDTWAQGGRPTLPRAAAPASITRPDTATARGHAALLRLRARLVDLACLGARDEAGRPLLATHGYFDEKSPRTIALSDAGAARLGTMMLAAIAVMVGLLVLFQVSDVGGFILLGGIGLALTGANTAARPAITRWLDALGETTTR